MRQRKQKIKPEKKAKVNLTNIVRFITGYTRKFSDSFGLLEDHKKEQVIWRTEMAKACTDNGTCLYCGCDTPAKYYSDEACEDPVRQCYPEMMTSENWKTYKKLHNLEIKIDG